MKNEEENAQKTNWLEQLSIESWQAELVISGAAIFGTFQLFDLINDLVDWLYFELPEAFMEFAYYLCWFLFITVSALVFSFLTHFFVRSLWIASIGLKSVYPNGIKEENENYSPSFMKSVIAHFPTLDEYNEYLDQMGSSILAISFYFVFSFLGFSVLIAGMIMLGYLLTYIMDVSTAYKLLITILLLAVAGSIFANILNQKSLRDRPWAQKLQFPLTLVTTGYFFSNLFYKPVFIFLYTFSSNINYKKFNLFIFPPIIFSLWFAATFMIQSNNIALNSTRFATLSSSQNMTTTLNYENEIFNKKNAVVSPVIPKRHLSNKDEFWLFIPLPNREKDQIYNACNEYVEPPKLSRYEVQENKREHHLKCIKEALTISLNDTITQDYYMTFHTYHHKQEPGVYIVFQKPTFLFGQNKLTIKHAWKSNDNETKIDRIIFYYTEI